jgi:hypothetical protein
MPVRSSSPIKAIKQAEKNMEEIQETISGIFEILNISLPDDDMYLNMGRDNLIKLYQSFIELLLNDTGTKFIRSKLYNSEEQLEITLDKIYKLNIKPKVHALEQ